MPALVPGCTTGPLKPVIAAELQLSAAAEAHRMVMESGVHG